MNSWADGYVTDIGYTHGFYRELTPALLSVAALVHNVSAPDLDTPLTYCELGCGQGDSANLLAAANPKIEFHATDFNPTHIAGAKALANASGLKNIHFYDSSFAEFSATPGLPQFDFISLHGIYSWVIPESRHYIVDFIRQKLKVGGLVYISYNAMPGWAGLMPLRRLMADFSGSQSGPTLGRIERGIAFAQRLADVGPAFFRANPIAGERLERIKSLIKSYVAHEYFNLESTPFYHSEVAADLAEAKLSFVGSVNLLDTLDAANFTAEQVALLKQAEDSTQRETLRDYILNQQFRRDLFVRGNHLLDSREVRVQWMKKRFVLSSRRGDVPLTVKGAIGEASLMKEIYEPILDVLADGPCTVEQLSFDPRTASIGTPLVVQAMTILVGTGHVQPALDAAGDLERSVGVRAFNRAVFEKSRASDQIPFLASPVSGGALNVDRISQLFVLAGQEKSDDPPAFVWQVLKDAGQTLIRDGKSVDSPEENLAELRTMHAKFTERLLPILESTGIA